MSDNEDLNLGQKVLAIFILIVVVVIGFQVESCIHWELAYEDRVKKVVAPLKSDIYRLERRVEELKGKE
jgi:hypothetical protein